MITYADMIKWTLKEIRIFLAKEPSHIGAQNALSEVEKKMRNRTILIKYGKRHSTVLGWTKVRRKGKCPNKKDLR